MVFSQDGRWLATGSYQDQTLRIWEAATGAIAFVFCEPRRVDNNVNSPSFLTFHPTADMFAYVTPSWDMCCRKTNTWKEVCLLEDQSEVTALSFSPTGNVLAIEWKYEPFCLWDIWGHAPLHFVDLGSFCMSLAFSPDGVTLAAATLRPALYLLNVPTGEILTTLLSNKKIIEEIAFSPDGRFFASSAEDGTNMLWDTDTWTAIKEFSGTLGFSGAQGFAANGSLLLIWDKPNGVIQVWDINRSKELACLTNQLSPIAKMCCSADGSRLAIGYRSGVVENWDTSCLSNG
jgi:WD40 repeat protein